MRAARAAGLWGLLACLLVGGGCYKPNVSSGGLLCAANGACPDGTTCDHSRNLCVKSGDGGVVSTGGTLGTGGKGGATGGTVGAGGRTDGGAGQAGTGGTGTVCLDPVPNCTTPAAAGGLCDPVCNKGCAACDQKCSLNTAGTLTCNPLNPAGKGLGLLAACHPTLPFGEPAMQTDDCGPGLACLNHNACGARCYKFCRTDADCPGGATCTVDAGGDVSFCDVPPVQCDPVNGAAMTPGRSGCTGNTQSCYLSSDTANTICDCYNTNVQVAGKPCAHSRDCYGGLVCADLTGGGKKCLRVCRLPAADGGADLTRRDAGGESGCIADYHNCVPILLPNNTLTTVYGACNE